MALAGFVEIVTHCTLSLGFINRLKRFVGWFGGVFKHCGL